MNDLHDVVHHYRVRPVLRRVDLRIELVVVLGPNGMGKTRLLEAIGASSPRLHESVMIDGKLRRGPLEEELAVRKTAVSLADRPCLPGNHVGREFLFAVGQRYDIEVERLVEHVERLLLRYRLWHYFGECMPPIAIWE